MGVEPERGCGEARLLKRSEKSVGLVGDRALAVHRCVTIARLDSAAKIAGTATRRFAREQADRLLGRLAFQIGRAIKSRNAEAIHDLRVAIRRFAQALRAFKPCFHGKALRKIRRELKQIMTVAGEVRNHDIALKLLAKSKKAQGTGFQAKMQNGRREAERSLITVLKRWLERKSSLKWRNALDAAAEAQDSFCKAPLAQTARQMLPGIAQDFFEQGDEAAGAKAEPRELHRFRLTSKKFRYTLELFTPLYAAPLNSKLEAIRRGQALLGDINDFETVRNMLAQYDGAEAATVWLKRRQRKRLVEFREYWDATFAPKTERRSWIDFLKGQEPRTQRKPAARTVTEARRQSSTAVA
jgi:CHAD domain-containing protein